MQKGLVYGLLLFSTMKPFILILHVWCCISCYILYSQRVCRGEVFDQYLVICQLKFTATLQRFSPLSGQCSFCGKVNIQPALFCTQFLWVPCCSRVRMLCVIFNIPFLMQRTQDRIVTHHMSHSVMTEGIF